jgi:hypothetical protein
MVDMVHHHMGDVVQCEESLESGLADEEQHGALS